MPRESPGRPFDSFSQFGTTHPYRRDAVLFEQGFLAEAVYVIDDGRVKLSRAEDDGSNVIVGLRASGSLLGDAAVLLAERHGSTAQAITDCRVRQIPADEFRRRVKTDPHLSECLHILQSREIQAQAARMASIGGLPARRRLERFLAETLESQKTLSDVRPQRITPPLKRTDVAGIVVTTPEHLSRLLRQLERDGLIRREHGWIVILRPEELARRGGRCCRAVIGQESIGGLTRVNDTAPRSKRRSSSAFALMVSR